jgi:hypothetical protein
MEFISEGKPVLVLLGKVSLKAINKYGSYILINLNKIIC